jgi:threonyl-tRNA synthetase
MWLNKLKIAIVEKNFKLLEELLEDIPSLSEPKEIEQAIYLLKEATTIVDHLKDETQTSMIQIKKNIDFLNSARADRKSKFDITS